MKYHNLFIILISLNLGIILADDDKCTSIEHCFKCPNNLTCEKCETGYKLNYENKCIESNISSQNCTNETNSSVLNPGPSNQQAADSNKNSSTSTNSENNNSTLNNSNSLHASNAPVASNTPHASNSPAASNAPQASNNPVASNAPIASNKQSSTYVPKIFGNLTFMKTCTYIVFLVVFILCIRWIFLKKKKGKVGYFYDESGYPGEKAKVVYIQ
jgi:hypothetical protein